MNFRNILFAGLVCVTLGGCATAPSPEQLHQMDMAKIPDPKTANAEVKRYFDRQLIDPYSAHYEYFMPTRGISNLGVGEVYFGGFQCGTINSKNRLGAYVGPEPFMVHFDEKTGEIDQAILTQMDTAPVIAATCNRLYSPGSKNGVSLF